ncbi:MAG: hypothetical protein H0U74_17815 [Bradymonadaceae bacterium]|nr:hypothetical protein [Lujinxingiaceae bacterium]
MVIRQDFIMRMIEQLAAAFSRVFAGQPVSEISDPQLAMVELDDALSEVLHVRAELLDVQPEDMLEAFTPQLAAEAARIFVARAQLARRLGRAQAWQVSVRFATRGLAEGIGHGFHTGQGTAIDLLREVLRDETLASAHSNQELSVLWTTIFEHEASRRRLATAEDAIFAAIALGTETEKLQERGLLFFTQLLELDDEDIAQGGLTRAEIVEALAELRGR